MTHLSIAELGTILSIWAHPDDETYLAGGIMAAAVAAGQRVVCVSATAGEHGTDDPVTWPPQRLGQVRRWETAAAMAVLGVTEHHFLDYADGALSEVDQAEAIARIRAIIDEVAPDTILTFGPDGTTFHPDHQAISQWTGAAWELAGRPGRLLHASMTDDHLAKWGSLYEQWQVFMTDERPVGVPREKMAIAITLSGADLDRKITALAAMSTQTSSAMAAMGTAYWELNSDECFVSAD
ncbi:PIG-L domain-containing protein [Rhizocola hellebori]|uniref:PIG-L domain-containing protein n=1 Tax=Rhizocola hellebori TaxID=1392758 RepID=A0A8J3VF04_9ACTN|nr:PIG-L family deacetylase [Rhizocola hellebori]GIH03702.1 PIG-L domain-containing protein [Rhizocola hellebori]